jgi:hypothetical protein
MGVGEGNTSGVGVTGALPGVAKPNTASSAWGSDAGGRYMKIAHSAKRAAPPTLTSISSKHPQRSTGPKYTSPTRFVLIVDIILAKDLNFKLRPPIAG